MVDALDSDSSGETRTGSTPAKCTNVNIFILYTDEIRKLLNL